MVLFHCLKLRYGLQVMAVLQTLIHGATHGAHIRVILGVEATQVLIPVQEAIPVEGSSSGGTNTGFTSAERKRISTVALKYLGINERDNIELIKQWLRDAGYDKPINSTAWCAVFVSMFFREAQIESRINTTRVADWRTWGKPTTKPQVGDLAFFPKGSHVGIVTAVNSSGSFQITHGNSGENNVKTTGYISNGNYTFRTKK